MLAIDRLRLLHITAVVLLSLGILCSCGKKDDGVHRSKDGVLLAPGEDFDD